MENSNFLFFTGTATADGTEIPQYLLNQTVVRLRMQKIRLSVAFWLALYSANPLPPGACKNRIAIYIHHLFHSTEFQLGLGLLLEIGLGW